MAQEKHPADPVSGEMFGNDASAFAVGIPADETHQQHVGDLVRQRPLGRLGQRRRPSGTARGPQAGTDIFCLHPHQDWFVLPESLVAPLPAGLPAERAVLTANMETALNGVWDAGIGPGDRVTVVGAAGLATSALSTRPTCSSAQLTLA